MYPPKPAIISFLLYLFLAFFFADTISFVERTMFRFATIHNEMVFPLFLAEGKLAQPTDFTKYATFPTGALHNLFQGYECGVENHFHKQEQWILSHQTTDTSQLNIPIDIGLFILKKKEDGKLSLSRKIMVSGWATQ